MKLLLRYKGGKGSGHHGHRGIPGEQGGSLPGKSVVTQSESFKKWFGDSKVVDKDGNPLIVYHGTTTDFTEFDANELGKNSDHPSHTLGFYFAVDVDVANDFAGTKQGANVIPVYLKIEHPYEIPAEQFADMLNFWRGMKNGNERSKSEYWRSVEYFENLQQSLIDDGYDGLIIRSGDYKKKLQSPQDDSIYPELFNDNYVVFWMQNNNQIKSATGNSGKFDPDDPDITKELIGYKGGPGSGHHGHSGRPGKVGGSVPGKGNYGAFGSDKKLYEWASRYIRGHWSEPDPEYDEPRMPWDIHHEAQTAARYRKDQNADIEGMELHGKGTFTDDGQYIENKRFITGEQFTQIYHEIQGELQERLDYIREASVLPNNYKEFLAGKDYDTIKNVWSLPREQLNVEYDDALARGRDILENMKANGYDITQFTVHELKYDIFNEYRRQMEDDYGKDNAPEGWLEMVGEGISKQYDFDVKHQITLGQLDPAAAKKLGADTNLGGNKDWEPLPYRVFHAATNATAIENSQLMSRRELGQRDGLGLGGGEDDTISLSSDEDITINIERSLHEAHLVASGQIKIGDLLEMAKDGAGAKKPYYDAVIGRGSPSTFDRLAEADAMGGNAEWSAEKVAQERWDLYHIAWLNARQYAGEGFENPVFFGTDWRGLAKLDPREFKTLSYTPKPGAMGQQMSGLGEWRIVGGDALDLYSVIDAFDTDDWGSILDWEKYK